MSALFEDFGIADTQNCGNFIHVPLCYQETEFTCGVACTQSILAYYGIHYSQTALADVLHSKPILGTDAQTILFFMQLLGFNAFMRENMEIHDIRNYIDSGIAPMLIIQAWKEDEIEYSYDWKDPHYIVACGYSKNMIYAMDPYTLGNYTCLSFGELLDRWHAVDQTGTRHINSGLIIQSDSFPPKYNYRTIKHLR